MGRGAQLSAEHLRVSFVADSDGWGGAEIWLRHHLRRASAYGVDASVVCSTQLVDRFSAYVPIERIAAVPVQRFASEAPEVAAALARQRPELVHVNLVDPGSNAAVIAAALDTATTVGTLHLAGDTSVPPGRAALAALYARMELLTTPTEEVRTQVLSELASPQQGVAVTRNGAEIPDDPAGPVGHRPPRIGVMCRLTPQKGLDVLLTSCRLLTERGVPFELQVAGSGRDEAALRAAAEGVPVEFVGWASDPRAFLRTVDVFCLSSRREALPLAMLEAMAEGLPCVSTDVGDVRAVLGSFLPIVPVEDPVALADALESVLTDPAYADRLARTGRDFVVAHLSADQMVASTFELLGSVLPR